jgi:putative transposase
MIDSAHDLPVSRQAELLAISRSNVYYLPRPIPAADLALMRRIDEPHLNFPFAGSRMLRDMLKLREFDVTKLSQRIVARDSKTDVLGARRKRRARRPDAP